MGRVVGLKRRMLPVRIRPGLNMESWTGLARQAVLKTVAPSGVQGSIPWLSAVPT